MSDPGGAVEVHGAVAVSGAVADGQDPESIYNQIETTRADLARTIDALADRVSPANNVRMLRDRAAEQLRRPEVQVGAAAVGVAIVGLAVLRMLSRHRHK